MSLKAGSLKDFDGSMAAAIEAALDAEWRVARGQPLPEIGRDDRRLLFIAVARGVLAYLSSTPIELRNPRNVTTAYTLTNVELESQPSGPGGGNAGR